MPIYPDLESLSVPKTPIFCVPLNGRLYSFNDHSKIGLARIGSWLGEVDNLTFFTPSSVKDAFDCTIGGKDFWGLFDSSHTIKLTKLTMMTIIRIPPINGPLLRIWLCKLFNIFS